MKINFSIKTINTKKSKFISTTTIFAMVMLMIVAVLSTISTNYEKPIFFLIAEAEDGGGDGDGGGDNDSNDEDSSDEEEDSSDEEEDSNGNGVLSSVANQNENDDSNDEERDSGGNGVVSSFTAQTIPADTSAEPKRLEDSLKPKTEAATGGLVDRNEIINSDVLKTLNIKKPIFKPGIPEKFKPVLPKNPAVFLPTGKLDHIVCIKPPCPTSDSTSDKNENDGMKSSDKNKNTKSSGGGSSAAKSSGGGSSAERSLGSNNVQTGVPTATENEVIECANEFAVPVVSILISGCINPLNAVATDLNPLNAVATDLNPQNAVATDLNPQNAVATDLTSFEGNATILFMGIEIPNVPVSNNIFATSLPTFIPVEYLSSDPNGMAILENLQNSTKIGLDKITNIHMAFAVDQSTNESYNELTYCYKETANTEELCGTETYVSEI